MSTDAITPSPTALRALAHPVRLRLLGMLRVDGPATASGLAQRLGMNSGATSYHLRQLAGHGFVVDDHSRGNGRERWWRAVHRTTEVPGGDEGDQSARDARHAFSQAVGVSYSRELQQAVEDESTLPDQWRPLFSFSDWSLRLTPQEAGQLLQDLHQVLERYRSWDPEDDEQVAAARHYRVLLQGFPRPARPDASGGP